jgi:hypothetical protein
MNFAARYQWLTPVVLAIEEAQITRISVQSQPGQIVCESLSQKKKKITKKGAGGVAQGVGPEFKPQYSRKKNYIHISIHVCAIFAWATIQPITRLLSYLILWDLSTLPSCGGRWPFETLLRPGGRKEKENKTVVTGQGPLMPLAHQQSGQAQD